MATSPQTQAAVTLYQQVKALRPATLNPNTHLAVMFDQLLAELRRVAADLALLDQGV